MGLMIWVGGLKRILILSELDVESYFSRAFEISSVC